MRANEDGSVVLTAEEAKGIADVLKQGRMLVEQLEAGKQGQSQFTVEHQLLGALDYLEDLGVSPEELTEKVDSRRQPG
jgi:hypothetical protein